MWIIEHASGWGTPHEGGRRYDWDMVLSGGDVDEGRWRGRFNAEIYKGWLKEHWGRWRVFRIRKLPGPERQ